VCEWRWIMMLLRRTEGVDPGKVEERSALENRRLHIYLPYPLMYFS
jgi:hypothetical protein